MFNNNNNSNNNNNNHFKTVRFHTLACQPTCLSHTLDTRPLRLRSYPHWGYIFLSCHVKLAQPLQQEEDGGRNQEKLQENQKRHRDSPINCDEVPGGSRDSVTKCKEVPSESAILQ